ncbi:hypothetical protein [Azohydromonas caseinilytica]|uniref:hypothetical protein n=1 Tax=Azohydromonas caseinilytica TaxID=2728836 RepID=UPI00197BB5D7|nr:hypothetical protein [Azohydromonas caseinilytica]
MNTDTACASRCACWRKDWAAAADSSTSAAFCCVMVSRWLPAVLIHDFVGADLVLEDRDSQVRYSDEMRLWAWPEKAGRSDNLLCVALVLEDAVVVKTVMHHWEVTPNSHENDDTLAIRLSDKPIRKTGDTTPGCPRFRHEGARKPFQSGSQALAGERPWPMTC